MIFKRRNKYSTKQHSSSINSRNEDGEVLEKADNTLEAQDNTEIETQIFTLSEDNNISFHDDGAVSKEVDREVKETQTASQISKEASEEPEAKSEAKKEQNIIGAFDSSSNAYLFGWAVDLNNPSNSVKLKILVDDREVGECIASHYREDLKSNAANGFSAFYFNIPDEYLDSKLHTVSVVNAADGEHIRFSPHVALLKKSPVLKPHFEGAGALVGKEGWLYLCNDSNECMEWFNGSLKFSDKEFQSYNNLFKHRKHYFENRGIPYIFSLIPGKESVYPEYLPDAVKVNPYGTLNEQVVSCLLQGGDMQVMDLKPILLAAKEYGQIFYKNDSHWNYLGAFFAYRAIMNAVRRHLPNVTPKQLIDFELKFIPIEHGDLVEKDQFAFENGEYRQLERIPVQGEMQPVLESKIPNTAKQIPTPEHLKVSKTRDTIIMEKPDKNLPRALVFRDSHTDWLIPFISEHFSRTTFIWQPHINRQVVESEKPDVVIHIMTERFLAHIPGS